MATEELKIKVSGDTKEAVNSIAILEKQLERLQKLASLPNLSFANQERLNSLLLKTQSQLTSFTKAQELAGRASKGFVAGQQQAGYAVTNLSRIISDAPFSILQGNLIAVSNNIDPLISSFRALSTSAGGAKGAIAALGTALSGGAGIALAVSAVTAAFVAFGPEIESFISGNDDASNAVVGLREEAKKLLEEIEKFDRGLSKNIQTLTDAASAATLFRREIRANIDALAQEAELRALLPLVDEFVKKAVAAKVELERLKRLPVGEEFLLGITKEEFDAQSNSLINIINKNVKEINNARKFLNTFFGSDQTILDILGIKNTDESTNSIINNTRAVRENLNTRAELNGALERFLENQIKQREELTKFQNEVLKNAPTRLPGSQINRPEPLFGTGENSSQLAELEGVNKKLIDISDTINNGINGGVDTLFNAIANNQDPFEALALSAKRLVVELGAAVVKALILRAITAAFTSGGSEGARLFGAVGGGLSGGGAGGGVLDLFLRSDLITGSIGRGSNRRRGF